jgi:hypothetical protein
MVCMLLMMVLSMVISMAREPMDAGPPACAELN